MDIELPRHSEMLARISSNKTLCRLYEEASPIAACLKKAGPSAQVKLKSIKGLCQVKVEFAEARTKLFGVLGETDLSILKQSKEFVEFYLPQPS